LEILSRLIRKCLCVGVIGAYRAPFLPRVNHGLPPSNIAAVQWTKSQRRPLRACSKTAALVGAEVTRLNSRRKLDDESGLPRSIDLLSSKSLFLKSHTDWDQEHSFGDRYTEWKEKTALKIQDGVLVFHYAVLESTNTLGRTFPTKFEFFQTGRQREQDGNWFCQGTGRVKFIRPSTKPLTLK
jgi:hypothetical protein